MERCDHFIKGVHYRWARHVRMLSREAFDQLLHVLALVVLLRGALVLTFFIFERVSGRIEDKADLHGISDRRDKRGIRVFMHKAQKFALILIEQTACLND